MTRNEPKKGSENIMLFRVSNQRWKYNVFYLLLILQLMLVGGTIIVEMQTEGDVLAWLGIRQGTVSFITTIYAGAVFLPWTMFSLRCPSCRKAMVWYIMNDKEQNDFVTQYSHILHVGCPACKIQYSSLLENNKP